MFKIFTSAVVLASLLGCVAGQAPQPATATTETAPAEPSGKIESDYCYDWKRIVSPPNAQDETCWICTSSRTVSSFEGSVVCRPDIAAVMFTCGFVGEKRQCFYRNGPARQELNCTFMADSLLCETI